MCCSMPTRTLTPRRYTTSASCGRTSISRIGPSRRGTRSASDMPGACGPVWNSSLLPAGDGRTRLLGQLLHEFRDGDFDLAVAAGEIILGRVIDEDIGLHAVVLHVRAAAVGQKHADERRANRGAVDEA